MYRCHPILFIHHTELIKENKEIVDGVIINKDLLTIEDISYAIPITYTNKVIFFYLDKKSKQTERASVDRFCKEKYGVTIQDFDNSESVRIHTLSLDKETIIKEYMNRVEIYRYKLLNDLGIKKDIG